MNYLCRGEGLGLKKERGTSIHMSVPEERNGLAGNLMKECGRCGCCGTSNVGSDSLWYREPPYRCVVHLHFKECFHVIGGGVKI
jgi:hypothetical protein